MDMENIINNVVDELMGRGTRSTTRPLPQHCCIHHCLCKNNDVNTVCDCAHIDNEDTTGSFRYFPSTRTWGFFTA